MEYVYSGSVPDAVRGMLDTESFSSRDTVLTWTKKITGADLSQWGSLRVALSEYERVCHIRHCAIHAGGYVSSRNAEILGVSAGNWITFKSDAAIHEIIAVVASTIRSFNQNLFEKLLERWINEQVLTGSWTTDKAQFNPLWKIFHSSRDATSSTLTNGGALRMNAYQDYRLLQAALIARAAS